MLQSRITPHLTAFTKQDFSKPVSWPNLGLMVPLSEGKQILAIMCLYHLEVLSLQPPELGGENK